MQDDNLGGPALGKTTNSMKTPLLLGGRPAAYDQRLRSKSAEFLREAELDDGIDEGSWLYEVTTNYRKIKNTTFDIEQSCVRFLHRARQYDRDMFKRDVIAGISSAGLLLPGVSAMHTHRNCVHGMWRLYLCSSFCVQRCGAGYRLLGYCLHPSRVRHVHCHRPKLGLRHFGNGQVCLLRSISVDVLADR